jgi:prepilin signal peptidase PulO-like enzyme (type II secretory pathway)
MKATKKGINYFLIAFIILSLIIPIISSATVVVNTPPPEKKPSFFDTYFGFLLSPIFWGFVVFFIIFIVILIGIFFLVRWLVKFLKAKNDIFYTLRKDRIKLAKIHRRYPSKHWLKVKKNVPIRLVSKDSGKLVISEPIANHRGDYTTNEGNVILSMNLRGNNKWLFYPITDLLIIPDKESVNIIKKNKHGKEEIIEIANLPRASEIIQFNEGEVLIFAESLSSVGNFYVPVLKAKDGKIIDLALPVYQSLREVVIGNYLYDQTSGFVNVAKKTMDLNPNLRYEVKAKDSNTNVEVPQGQGTGR